MLVSQIASECFIEMIQLDRIEIKYVAVLKFSSVLCNLAWSVIKCEEGRESIYRIQYIVMEIEHRNQ